MCRPVLTIAALVLLCAGCLHAEDAAEMETHGIEALKLSQTNSDAIVSATIFFGKAAEAYTAAGNEGKTTEMNSFIYWCKKKMTLQQMDAFLKEHETAAPALVKRLKEIEKETAAGEAQKYYDRAEAYAAAHANEHYLIAVRFFEVADRFRGTELSLKAQERSLAAQQQALAAIQPKAPAPPPSALAPRPGIAPAAEAAQKSPVPAAADLKKAEKTIKDLFKAQYQKTTPDDRAALARELLTNARTTQGDPAGKYVLLREAKDLAVLAGDAATVLQALELMDKEFTVDALAMKLESLAKTASSAAAPEAKLAIAKAYVAEIETLEAADNFDAAAKFFTPAETAVRRVADAPTLQGLMQRVKDARDLQAEYLKVKKALETLASNPDDPGANLAAGLFYCAVKDNWAVGLPLLQKCDDPKFKEAAAAELNQPASAEDKARVADNWLALTGQVKNRASQTRVQLHAKKFYEDAILVPAKGLLLARLWSKMKDMPAPPGTETPKGAGKPLDRAFADKFVLSDHGFRNDMFHNKTVVEYNAGKKPTTHPCGPMLLADELWGKKDVFSVHPPSEKKATTVDLSGITENTQGTLTIHARNVHTGDVDLDIVKGDKVEKTIKVGGDIWKTEKIVFQREPVKLVARASGWWREWAFITYEIELQ